MKIRDREIRTQLTYESLSGSKIRKVALPRFEDDGEILRFLLKENVPGSFPYTAGVFAFKREGEDPTRMFAGEGDAFRTNQRFKRVSEGMPAHRLSTAFDSVTLYGWDPDLRPDIYGKVGNSGVSIATLDDMKVLYAGFDLCAPTTSVSMTINGPAPMILAMFMNTAIDQQLEKFQQQNGREPTADEQQKINAWTLSTVRGTVQADILKEDQGQNTCIFSTEFALKMMGDMQEYFVHHQVQNFYSVSISGYHIAEAGANPISQLAFTLANGFTFVESYLARGMHIDDFAPNLSFFFSNGMDPEYSVIGRVARRIWAVAMKNKYGANERSQKLKYHVQTSGRSLHAQEMAFNDIRTTLQALFAIYDNCNSLHTNAYDEAVTTPTEESVRRAMAIQLIINREWGLAKNENPNQGSFIIDELTDLVEEAVLKEFDAIAERGGVLGAMETGYQRGKIQEESLFYERQKHDGSYPIIGVNTFRNPHSEAAPEKIELARSTDAEKQSQLKRLKTFQDEHAPQAPELLERLRRTVIDNGNTFEVLMDAVRGCPWARSLTLCTTSAAATAATCRIDMHEYQAPLTDMKFVLRELVDLKLLAQLPGFGEMTPDVADAVLDEAAKFAGAVLSPLNRSGDLEGVRWQDGAVLTAAGWKQAYDAVCGGRLERAFLSRGFRRPESAAGAVGADRGNVERRQCGVRAVPDAHARGHRCARAARHAGAARDLSAEDGQRRVDRHHESDRAAGGLGSVGGAHPRRAHGRWPLSADRSEDFHHLRRARLDRQYRAHGAGARGRGAGGRQRHLAVPGAEIPGECRRLLGRAQRCALLVRRAQARHSRQSHLRAGLRPERRRHR